MLVLLFIPEDACDMFFRNVGWLSSEYMGIRISIRENSPEDIYVLNYGAPSKIFWTQNAGNCGCTYSAEFHRG
jgi:hypothetical protein